MNSDGQGWIQERYPDILREGDDEAVVRVVRDLDLAYQLGDLPLDRRAPRREDLQRRRFQTPDNRRVWRRRLSLAGALVLAVFAVIGVAVAASNILNLGKPTSTTSTAPAFPLSGFHRVKVNLVRGSRAELLFVATQVDQVSAAERWAVVKAVQQFGTLSGVRPDASTFGGSFFPQVGTFDLSHATYRSPYLVFVHADLLGNNSHKVPYQTLSGLDKQVYYRYARAPHAQRDLNGKVTEHDAYHVYATLANRNLPTTRQLPLVAVGDYLQTISQVVVEGDFEPIVPVNPNDPSGPTKTVGFSFDDIRQALETGKDPTQSHLVEDVNAEANIITALICHADGAQPSKVCGRAAIKQILRHVR
jgi:hypothetical protein